LAESSKRKRCTPRKVGKMAGTGVEAAPIDKIEAEGQGMMAVINATIIMKRVAAGWPKTTTREDNLERRLRRRKNHLVPVRTIYKKSDLLSTSSLLTISRRSSRS